MQNFYFTYQKNTFKMGGSPPVTGDTSDGKFQ